MWNYLTGKKSYIGGALIALGAAGEYFGFTGVGSVIATIGAGVGVVGVAHKAERLVAAIKEIVSIVNDVIKEK